MNVNCTQSGVGCQSPPNSHLIVFSASAFQQKAETEQICHKMHQYNAQAKQALQQVVQADDHRSHATHMPTHISWLLHLSSEKKRSRACACLNAAHELHMAEGVGLQSTLDQLERIIIVGEDQVLLIWICGPHVQDPPEQGIKLGGPGSDQLHLQAGSAQHHHSEIESNQTNDGNDKDDDDDDDDELRGCHCVRQQVLFGRESTFRWQVHSQFHSVPSEVSCSLGDQSSQSAAHW